jgi:hypothetical protein
MGAFGYGGHAELRGGTAMLTKDILYGMNVLTLVGLILTGFGLTLQRSANAGVPLCIAVMGVGTALVLAGLYASGLALRCNSNSWRAA